mmetsp:Transcript_84693/g.196918  ORF Transcript_84693/g.196918 Transcript_84693/m.196918 type:complete len:433 (-) Transcript_84693:301-1599(-)
MPAPPARKRLTRFGQALRRQALRGQALHGQALHGWALRRQRQPSPLLFLQCVDGSTMQLLSRANHFDISVNLRPVGLQTTCTAVYDLLQAGLRAPQVLDVQGALARLPLQEADLLRHHGSYGVQLLGNLLLLPVQQVQCFHHVGFARPLHEPSCSRKLFHQTLEVVRRRMVSLVSPRAESRPLLAGAMALAADMLSKPLAQRPAELLERLLVGHRPALHAWNQRVSRLRERSNGHLQPGSQSLGAAGEFDSQGLQFQACAANAPLYLLHQTAAALHAFLERTQARLASARARAHSASVAKSCLQARLHLGEALIHFVHKVADMPQSVRLCILAAQSLELLSEVAESSLHHLVHVAEPRLRSAGDLFRYGFCCLLLPLANLGFEPRLELLLKPQSDLLLSTGLWQWRHGLLCSPWRCAATHYPRLQQSCPCWN